MQQLLRYWLIKGITIFQLKLLTIIMESGNERLTLEDFKEGVISFEADEIEETKGYSGYEHSRSNIKSYIRKSLDDLEDKGIIKSEGGASKSGRTYRIMKVEEWE